MSKIIPQVKFIQFQTYAGKDESINTPNLYVTLGLTATCPVTFSGGLYIGNGITCSNLTIHGPTILAQGITGSSGSILNARQNCSPQSI